MDSTLMHNAAQATFATLLESHRGIVLKVAGTYARDVEDRADLAQEIAAQLWRAWPGYDDRRPFSTWMYRIALNVAISWVRGNAPRVRRQVPFDAERHDRADERGNDADADERRRLLDDCLARLNPVDRALLLLYLDERPHAEIGEVLGISTSNVATRIARLKLRIRNEFETDGA